MIPPALGKEPYPDRAEGLYGVPEPDPTHAQVHQVDLRAQEDAGDLRSDHDPDGYLLSWVRIPAMSLGHSEIMSLAVPT